MFSPRAWSGFASRRLAQRAGIACAVLAGHAAILMLMAWEIHPATSVQPGDNGQVVTVSLISALPAESTPKANKAKVEKAVEAEPVSDPVGTQPADPVEASEPVDDSPMLSEAETQAVEAFDLASATGEPDAPCNLTQTLSGVLAQSPAVRLGLDELPLEQRSVANAVMLWDGQWPGDTRIGGKAVLRALLVKAVSTAQPPCLTAQQRGPALFLIPDNDRTVVLAVGSGLWTWGDLLTTPSDVGGDYLLTAASGFPTLP